MSFLHIDHVSKYFPNPSGDGQVCIFKDVTIKIEKGEFVTTIGHSGCGKSTLLNIIAGLETPSEGGVIAQWSRGFTARGWTGWWSSRISR